MKLKIYILFILTFSTSLTVSCSPTENESSNPGFQQFELIPDPPDVTITTLFDNIENDNRLTTEWGFSALIEYGDVTILFDTGLDGSILINNMNILGIDPQEIDKIVISHDHGDHTGGLEAILQTGITPDVYLLGSFSSQLRSMVESYTNLFIADEAVEITRGVYSTGQVPINVTEQALIVTTKQGLVTITGCAHPGADVMVNKTNQLIDGDIYLVMGGFHMGVISGALVQDVIDHFREHGVQNVMCSHCTGYDAMNIFRNQYGTNFFEGGVGRVITITD
ncbi:MBL fold metallo-hydrolase [Bacteroidota bacterium]